MRPTHVFAAALIVVLAQPAPLAAAVPTAPAVVAPMAAPKKVAPKKVAPLRVASYNVMCEKCSRSGPDAGSWQQRRVAVAMVIKQQRLDVIGLQEASQGWLTWGGKKINRSQFEDIRALVGGPYRLTNSKRNNCLKPQTPTRCRYKYQGASQGTRILYNSRRLTLLGAGSRKLSYVDPGSNGRFVAWAKFGDRVTGKKFVFATTQLEHRKDTSRTGWRYYNLKKRQAAEVVATVRKVNTGRWPAVIAGDLNSSRFSKPYNGPVNIVTRSGYVNPLGGRERSTTMAPGAIVGKRVNTWLNSYNGLARTALGHRSWRTGSHIDYIFVSKGTRVTEFEVVARLDARKRRHLGRIPSDHNLLRATIWLR